MDFENVFLTKSCSCLCDRGHNIHDIKSTFSQNIFIFKT